MIGFSDDQLLRMADAALKKGEFGQCRELFRKVSELKRPKHALADVTYRLAKQNIAHGRYEQARELFAEVTQTHPSNVARSLSQERNQLINRISSRKQSPVTDLQSLFVEVQIKTARLIAPEMLQPDISFVGCPAAYRSGYDRQRSDPLSVLIRMMKRGVEETAVQRLGQYLAAYIYSSTPTLRHVDFVIPVPTRPERETQRGYSIPRILAEEVSRLCAIPLHEEFVRTSGESIELRDIPKWYRKYAVDGAFEIGRKAEWLSGQIPLIVDDVITTGSTIRKVARLLRTGEVQDVYAVALAHTEWSG